MGLFLKGLERESVLTNSRYLGPGLIQGNLFDLGFYPGLTEGSNTVIGEMYEVDKEVIGVLDKIEGYDPRSKTESLFVRQEVEVRKFADGNYINAFCYFYNHPITGDVIYHGDYRRFLLEKENNDQWVLAYGSNLSSKRLKKELVKSKSTSKDLLMALDWFLIKRRMEVLQFMQILSMLEMEKDAQRLLINYLRNKSVS